MQTLHSPTQAAQWLRQHVTGVLCTDSRAVYSCALTAPVSISEIAPTATTAQLTLSL